MAGALGGLAIGGVPTKAFAAPRQFSQFSSGSDRILVLLQLFGGNDGLNTVIPVDNDIYFQSRPTLAIPKADAISIGDGVGLHPALAPLMARWAEGDLAIVRNVGYEDASFSHFASSDIWFAGQDRYETPRDTGWAGRYLDIVNPLFLGNEPEFPLAVQVGRNSVLFDSETANYGMSVANEEVFQRLVETGSIYRGTDEDSLRGAEIGFLRRVANDSVRYSQSLLDAAAAGRNAVVYPEPVTVHDIQMGGLGQSLAISARLIKGGLGARVYFVSLDHFDTHGRQSAIHATLLGDVAQSLELFFSDLAETGDDERVMVMAFSEFGRTVYENAGLGTEHGTGTPVFLLGKGVSGGLYGAEPDLTAQSAQGNFEHETDFRSVYSSVLSGWFGATDEQLQATLDDSFPSLGLISTTGGGAPSIDAPDAVGLSQPEDGAERVARTPTLSWEETANAARYSLEVSLDSNFSSVVATHTAIPTTEQLLDVLLRDQLYFWRVRGISAGGLGAWSQVRSFRTSRSNVPPEVSSSPAEVQVLLASGPLDLIDLDSVFSDADGEQLSYSVSSSDDGIVAVSLSGTRLLLTPVQVGNAVVSATATDGYGETAEVSFATVVGNTPPATLMSIADIDLVLGGESTVILSGHFGDADGHALDYSVSAREAGIVQVDLDGDSLMITGSGIGTTIVLVGAADEYGGATSAEFGVTVSSGVGTESADIPTEYSLGQNFPNPFGSRTNLEFGLPSPTRVILRVYDLNGRLIDTVLNEQKSAGFHLATWKPRAIPSGMYFCEMRAGVHRIVRRLIYTKG